MYYIVHYVDENLKLKLVSNKKNYFRGLQNKNNLLYLTTLKHKRIAKAVPIINRIA